MRQIINVSLPAELANVIDRRWRSQRYANRSEYFRDLAKRDLVSAKNLPLRGPTAAALLKAAGTIAVGGDAVKEADLIYE